MLGPVALSLRNAAGMRDWELRSRKGCGAGPVATAAVGVCGTSALPLCDEEVYALGPEGDHALRRTCSRISTGAGRWCTATQASTRRQQRRVRPQRPRQASPGTRTQRRTTRPPARGPPKKAEGRVTLQRLSGDVSGASAWPPRPPSIPPSLEGINTKAVPGIPALKEEEPAKQSRTSGWDDQRSTHLSDYGGLSNFQE